jgi:hypothetical protein
VPVGHEIYGDHVRTQGDVGMGFGRGDQRLLHGPAGCIVDVDDAAMRMAAFTRQVQGASLGIEGHADLFEPADCLGGVFDHELDRFTPVKARAGHHRIAHVIIEGVALIEHGGDPALSPRG